MGSHESDAPDAAPAERPRRSGRWWELPALALLAVVVAVLVKTFLIQPFYIPSGSMIPTLNIGDKILVNKTSYDFSDPRPGDIVVFAEPKAWAGDPDGEVSSTPHTNLVTGPIRWFGQLVGVVPPDGADLVKRVVAVGGQRIKCCDAQGQPQVQDAGSTVWRSLDEPFLAPGSKGESPFAPVLVPPGRLWVMGDNRNNSADSRYHCAPGQTDAATMCADPSRATVAISRVVGKAFVVVWPSSHWRTLGTPPTFTASTLAASGAPLATGGAVAGPLLLLARRRRQRF
jgi:signal peptidase I